ncbi:activating transcription factor 7-interacting protein 2 isoform X1, partial [Tachysurus ichikawai]
MEKSGSFHISQSEQELILNPPISNNLTEKPRPLCLVEVQELISTEVQSALEQSDKMMKALMERIQEVESEPRYNARLQKLEAHIRKVKRRGDAVFADLRKRRSLDTAQDQ